jgi:hypothetical protein
LQKRKNPKPDLSAPNEPSAKQMEIDSPGLFQDDSTLKRQKTKEEYSSPMPPKELPSKLQKEADKFSQSANSIFNPNNLKDKSRKKMMEHYQKEDFDDGCYYSNAIKCSFDDPRLIFEEMCYLCGSFGNQEDFVTCTLCAESFHTYCL